MTRILVIDDEPLYHKMIAHALRKKSINSILLQMVMKVCGKLKRISQTWSSQM